MQAAKPETVICRVFGTVLPGGARCLALRVRTEHVAQNGQYLGLFQMGTTARRLYGHGPTALEQATAAHRYFVDSGHGWGAWSCKPY